MIPRLMLGSLNICRDHASSAVSWWAASKITKNPFFISKLVKLGYKTEDVNFIDTLLLPTSFFAAFLGNKFSKEK